MKDKYLLHLHDIFGFKKNVWNNHYTFERSWELWHSCKSDIDQVVNENLLIGIFFLVWNHLTFWLLTLCTILDQWNTSISCSSFMISLDLKDIK